MNFREYWKINKELYTQLGVTEETAYKIWCDAADQLFLMYMKNEIKKL